MVTGDDLKINYIPPYPRKGNNDGRPARRKPGEIEEEEEQEERNCPEGETPEVKDGHIDTRVSPL
jgi:hypothetical protein